MIDFFYTLDKELFYFINHTLSNPIFDKIFPYLTDVKHWYLVYIIFWLILIIKGGRLGRITAMMSLFLITASDQISSFLLKDWIARIRPCNVLPEVNILVFCSGSYSMPSSHAVNNFAAAVFLSKLFPKYKIPFYTIAVLMAFSRPYVGVHYPADIIVGAVVGAVIGYIFAILTLRIDEYFLRMKLPERIKIFRGKRKKQKHN